MKALKINKKIKPNPDLHTILKRKLMKAIAKKIMLQASEFWRLHICERLSPDNEDF